MTEKTIKKQKLQRKLTHIVSLMQETNRTKSETEDRRKARETEQERKLP